MKSPPPPKKLNFYYENLYFVVKIIISIIVFYSMHINFVQGKDYPSFSVSDPFDFVLLNMFN